MQKTRFLIAIFLILSFPLSSIAAKWRTQPLSSIDKQYMADQIASIDDLARRNFGRYITGQKDNDIAVIQRLLDDAVVKPSDVKPLQAMGIILGSLLASERGLKWIVYIDAVGRSRALQVTGFDKDFIFPTTQISRKVEVGNKVNVEEIYRILEQSITDIRKKPPF
jgi:hypothetical protein